MRSKGARACKVARQNAYLRGAAAAKDPLKSRQHNPESSWRNDLRQAWDRGYVETSVLELTNASS